MQELRARQEHRSRSPVRRERSSSKDEPAWGHSENDEGLWEYLVKTETGSTLNLEALSVTVTPEDPLSWTRKAAQIFKDCRVVIMRDLFSPEVTGAVWKSMRELHQNWSAKYDPDRIGNRCTGRYDVGAAYDTAHITHLPGYLEALEEFSRKGGLQFLEELGEYKFVGGQGQLCLAQTDTWQPLHSDFRRPSPSLSGLWQDPGHVPFLCLMMTVHPLTSTNGAMRIVPGQPSVDQTYWQQGYCQPPTLGAEPDFLKRSQLYPLPAGCGILRDIRVWHGGVPNTSDEDRHIPVLQFYSSWSMGMCKKSLHEGRGVDEDDVRSKLSPETQKIVAEYIIRRKDDSVPVIVEESSRWAGVFGESNY